MKHPDGMRADNPHLPFPQARITASLRELDRARRARARAAADAMLDCLRRFVDSGRVPLAMLLGDQTAPNTMQHYQHAGAAELDGTAGTLHYYYHTHHTARAAAAEHGHFHLFAQLGADADGIAQYTHLLAIGVDARGLPQRLFTTNRWVTGETWLPAQRSIALIEQLARSSVPDEATMERWLRAQLGVFAPQVVELLQHRDRRMAARQRDGQRPGLLEDRRMHVLSQCLVSVERQLTAIDRVIH